MFVDRNQCEGFNGPDGGAAQAMKIMLRSSGGSVGYGIVGSAVLGNASRFFLCDDISILSIINAQANSKDVSYAYRPRAVGLDGVALKTVQSTSA
jgi:hypothetical protein